MICKAIMDQPVYHNTKDADEADLDKSLDESVADDFDENLFFGIKT